MSHATSKNVEVHNDAVVINSRYSNRPTVANIVAKETDKEGREIIYLASLIHTKNDVFEGYDASGCVSTILTSQPVH